MRSDIPQAVSASFLLHCRSQGWATDCRKPASYAKRSTTSVLHHKHVASPNFVSRSSGLSFIRFIQFFKLVAAEPQQFLVRVQGYSRWSFLLKLAPDALHHGSCIRGHSHRVIGDGRGCQRELYPPSSMEGPRRTANTGSTLFLDEENAPHKEDSRRHYQPPHVLHRGRLEASGAPCGKRPRGPGRL